MMNKTNLFQKGKLSPFFESKKPLQLCFFWFSLNHPNNMQIRFCDTADVWSFGCYARVAINCTNWNICSQEFHPVVCGLLGDVPFAVYISPNQHGNPQVVALKGLQSIINHMADFSMLSFSKETWSFLQVLKNEALWASLQPDCPQRMFCCSAEMPLSKYACPWAVICYMYECHWRICEACRTGRRVAWMMRMALTCRQHNTTLVG